ncbi:4Fe-4S binding protein [Natronincola ferrireducens]|uniref:4Fe-4S binding domain-containing protein n=1 Tax=Natronincola ferrireducens TaxID=393762 RepID=A0A1G9IEH7_9FIRM|nr:4Fe-4S binding protein [Natronincola ferrireducens]SDL23641.1 4Fe-4S binding domain-containing protein [Natronincola ferrireducens]
MSKIFNQKQQQIVPKHYTVESTPISIIYYPNKPSYITFQTGTKLESTCLSCIERYCLNYKESELSNSLFSIFPNDKNTNVCPVNAIKWLANSSFPHVDSNLCINCGLCASRCPVGAIYLSQKTAIVNTRAVEKVSLTNKSNHMIMLSKLFRTKKEGSFQDESDALIDSIYKKLLCADTSSQFPNLFTRNLLIQLKLNTLIRRKGDVNIRMDGIFSSNSSVKGVLEIEFGKDVLNSPRNILDDLAVLSSRYNYSYKELTPLIISLNLPNTRTEYWRVIKDVNNVLNIRIQSLTIGSLMILMWNNSEVNFNKDNFYIDCDNYSLENQIITLLGRSINISNLNFSITKPNK